MQEEHFCRTCLNNSFDLTSLFKKCTIEGIEMTLSEIVEICTSLKITESDKFQQICRECVIKLSKSYVFRQQCLQAESIIQELETEIKENEAAEQEENIEFLISDDSNLEQYLDYNTSIEPIKIAEVKSKLNNSTAKPNEIESFLCNICGKACTSKINFKNHIRIHDPSACLSCKYCEKLFTSKSGLEIHLTKHTKEKPYKCEICEHASRCKSDLKTHMRIHTGEKPYECDICGQRARTASHMAEHKRSHSDERPHECVICGKTFKKKRIYMKHLKIHDVDNHLPCQYCDKKFAFAKNLEIHQRRHTGYRPFVCLICGKGFIQRYYLTGHMKTAHKDVTEAKPEAVVELTPINEETVETEEVKIE